MAVFGNTLAVRGAGMFGKQPGGLVDGLGGVAGPQPLAQPWLYCGCRFGVYRERHRPCGKAASFIAELHPLSFATF